MKKSFKNSSRAISSLVVPLVVLFSLMFTNASTTFAQNQVSSTVGAHSQLPSVVIIPLSTNLEISHYPDENRISQHLGGPRMVANSTYFEYNRNDFLSKMPNGQIPEHGAIEVRLLDSGETYGTGGIRYRAEVVSLRNPSQITHDAHEGRGILVPVRGSSGSNTGQSRGQQQQQRGGPPPNMEQRPASPPPNLGSASSANSNLPNVNANPVFGSSTLQAGFTPDPHMVTLEAGGSTAVPIQGCAGFINSAAPDHNLYYTPGQNYPLSFYAQSDADVTLLIRTPDGLWYCESNTGNMQNALIYFMTPKSGLYNIWVGTRQRVEDYPAATVAISEETLSDSVPAQRIR